MNEQRVLILEKKGLKILKYGIDKQLVPAIMLFNARQELGKSER